QLGRIAETQADAAGGAGAHAVKQLRFLPAERVDLFPGDGPDHDVLKGQPGDTVREIVDEKALADDGSVGEAGDRDVATGETALEIDLSSQNDSEKPARG